MGELSLVASPLGSRKVPQVTLASLICRALRERGEGNEFLQSVVEDLVVLKEELRRTPSRRASIRLVRRTIESARSRGREEGEEAKRDAETKEETTKPEENITILEENEDEVVDEPLDVPDSAGRRKKRCVSDSYDAMPPDLVRESQMIRNSKGDETKCEVTLQGVVLEEVAPNRKGGRLRKSSSSGSRFFLNESYGGEHHRQLQNIKLVQENNTCKIYELNSRRHTLRGSFHADNLDLLKNGKGFQVTFKAETMALDAHDGGKQPKVAKRQKGQTEERFIRFVVPEEQQHLYRSVFSKMRKTFWGIMFGRKRSRRSSHFSESEPMLNELI